MSAMQPLELSVCEVKAEAAAPRTSAAAATAIATAAARERIGAALRILIVLRRRAS
jgi:hypothetical protein